MQQSLKRDGLPVRPIKPKGDKVMRMRVHTPTLEAGKVLLKKDAPWLNELRAEMLAFPYGKHDDFSKILRLVKDDLSALAVTSSTRFDFKQIEPPSSEALRLLPVNRL